MRGAESSNCHEAPLLTLSLMPPEFVLLHRPGVNAGDVVELLAGPVRELPDLTCVPSPDQNDSSPVFLLVPYRTATELGLHCQKDDAALLAMRVHQWQQVRLGGIADIDTSISEAVADGRFDVTDAEYEDVVRRVVAEEIGRGQGANFVIARSFVADIPDHSTAKALAIFQHLLEHERGAYWTFLIHTKKRTLVGATPERHITLSHGVATMNPISGTFRYPKDGATVEALIEFLNDSKESDELYMVLDEELKMMAAICHDLRVVGPHLRMMAHLAHTEYFISGRTSRPSAEIIRRTLFAPTVVGSPLANAFRVIDRHERAGRGYYSGIAALISRTSDGIDELDSAILIRTAEIRPNGQLRISTGATVVRHSRPAEEAAETQVKARGLLAAMGVGGRSRPPLPTGASAAGADSTPQEHPELRRLLRARNARLNRFWFDPPRAIPGTMTIPGKPRVLVLDAEDAFTSMLGHHVRALGCLVDIRSAAGDLAFDEVDCVLLGPGPGNPLALDDPRIARMHGIVRYLLSGKIPFLAVCLSHQILCSQLGLPIHRRHEPHQGVQREITFFGRPEWVGSYNTYFAVSDRDRVEDPAHGGFVEVCRDELTGEVHALRGTQFSSVQFHLESVLTRNGGRIAATLLTELCGHVNGTAAVGHRCDEPTPTSVTEGDAPRARPDAAREL